MPSHIEPLGTALDIVLVTAALASLGCVITVGVFGYRHLRSLYRNTIDQTVTLVPRSSGWSWSNVRKNISRDDFVAGFLVGIVFAAAVAWIVAEIVSR